MICEICGSRKEVRRFFGMMQRNYYTECRKCFEKVMEIGLQMMGKPKSEWKNAIEQEWKMGAEK